MSFVYPNARALAWAGAIDLSTDTIKAALVRPTTTCAADVDAKFVADFATLDETEVSGYARQTLASVAIVDPGTGTVTVEADDVDFGVLEEGFGDTIGGVLLYIDNGSAAADVPLAFIDSVDPASISFPYLPIGSQFVVEWLAGIVFEL